MRSITGPRRQPARRIAGLVVGMALAGLIAVPAAWASTPFTDIHSSGPLSDIYIGNDLGCQVREGGFSSTEYFPNAAGPGDCGTFLFLNSDNVSGGLFGPDFANHAGGTATSFTQRETPFTSAAGNQSVTGSGTTASPYKVTTIVTLTSPTGNTPVVLQLTEVDSYIVGNNFYETDVTVTNTGSVTPDNGGQLYHAGNCLLRGSSTGFGAPEPNSTSPNTAACTPNVLGNPPSALEEFMPITAGNTWEQRAVPALWADLNSNAALLNECDNCRGTATDNGEAIEYPVPALAPGQSSSVSFDTQVVDTVPTGGFTLSSNLGKPTAGTVATISDPNTSAGPTTYSATINWGDANSSAGTITGSGGNFTVTGSHTYAGTGTYPVSVTITSAGTSLGSTTVGDSATVVPPTTPVVSGLTPSAGPTAGGTSVTITGNNFTGATAVNFGSNGATNLHVVNSGQITATSPPGTGTVNVTVTTPNGTSPASSVDRFSYLAPPPPPSGAPPASLPGVSGGAPTVTTTSAADVVGVVNPGGALTTAYFEYGLDLSERGPGSSTTLYDQSTPPQQVGSDSLNHTLTASLTGLFPAALYHIRLVATNSAGTTFGPDVIFKTRATPPPGPPTLGRTFNISPVSGIVLIKVGGQFIPLTELRKIPANALIDALHGTLKLTTATPGGIGGARDAAAKRKKRKAKTQSGTFGGAVFKIGQTTAGASKGLVTLAIVEGAFSGAPSYSACTAHLALEATAASTKTLQLLHASAKGKFRTKGKYSAATVLGTKWTVADRCDGTLTHDITDSVSVNDFVRHKTIVLHAGQSYLAKAPKHK